ncbi:MAG: M15 family metallopeptidase [Acidimicrobiia bacterium]|nr:M15 family metallopeptidase [Acidimicrobiia bacterium]
MSILSRRNVVRLFVALVAGLSMLFVVPLVPLVAQDDDVEELEELQEERDRIAKEAAIAVGQIDVVTATVDEVTKALDELEAFVSLQRVRLEEAERRHAAALDAVDAAQEEQDRVVDEMALVEAHLTDLAVSSFTGEGGSKSDDMTELVLSDDPGESARFIHLLELQTGSLSDGIDHLRSLELRALQLVEEEAQAAAEATESLAVVDERVAQLDEALVVQERVVTGAQIRLEAQIAEAAILQERDVELALQIRDQQHSINQRIAVAARANGVEIPAPVDLEKIVRLDFYDDALLPAPKTDDETGEELPVEVPVDIEPFFSIEVHEEIAEQTRALFDTAFDAGIDLGGWGYRPIQLQIELRAAHCGGTEYDIWHKPVFECAPPTARPGFSKHEQGRAIDFTLHGTSIKSKDNAAFRWLTEHAPQYGFVNLESEPWHWSIAAGDEQMPES